MIDNKRINTFVYLLVFLLVFFIPSASAVGGFQLWYIITIALVYIGAFKNKLIFDNITRTVFHFILFSFTLLFISLLASMNYGAIQDFTEILRLIGILGIFYFMYVGYSLYWEKKIVLFLKLFLLLQLVFCFFQSNDSVIRIMGYIWNTERIWDLRRTGSFANPNILSIYCIASFSYIFFRSNTFSKLFYGLIVFGIILFASSKTGLIAFLIIICLNFFLIRSKFSFRNLIRFVGSIFVIGYLSYTLLIMYEDQYPYIAQILVMFDNDLDASQIKSIGDRQVMWDNALFHFNQFSFMQQLVGIGPAKETVLNVIDNEFLTILVKMGIIGLVFYILSLIILLIFLFKNKVNLGAKSMISIVVVFLLTSVTASTFIAWQLSLLFFLFLGLCLKEIKIGQSKKV